MMMAHLTADLTTIEEFPLRVERLRERYPHRSFPSAPTDDTFADLPRVVLVRDTVPPVVEHGDVLLRNTPALEPDGHWHERWTLTSPDAAQLDVLKDALRDAARDIAETKMSPPLTATEIMTFAEIVRFEADLAPASSDYPLLVAVRDGRGLTTAAAATAVRASLDQWNNRAQVVQTKLHDVLLRINSATTGAQLKALQDELDAV